MVFRAESTRSTELPVGKNIHTTGQDGQINNQVSNQTRTQMCIKPMEPAKNNAGMHGEWFAVLHFL